MSMGNCSDTLKNLEQKKQKTLLIGVTFALLDFAKEYLFSLKAYCHHGNRRNEGQKRRNSKG